jgi:hypothetical protein
MLRDEFEGVATRDPTDLQAAYEAVVADTVRDQGVESVAAQTDVERARLQGLVDGESVEMTLKEAAQVLETDPDRPDAEFIVADARDVLLMGMSTAVLDVDRVQSGIDGRMEAKEIQQKVEGRQPMTLAEYALLHQFIESEKR